jgi:hypothetical protein
MPVGNFFETGPSFLESSSGGETAYVVRIRPELPDVTSWKTKPIRALYKLIKYPIKCVLYPLYKERTEILERYMKTPSSEEAKAVAAEISVSSQNHQLLQQRSGESSNMLSSMVLATCMQS